MSEKVENTNIERQEGYVYFIDKSGNVARAKRGSSGKQTVKRTHIKRESGYMYYLDDEGDVARVRR